MAPCLLGLGILRLGKAHGEDRPESWPARRA